MDTLSSMEAGMADDAAAIEPCMDPPPAIGRDERRMHVRAYNYWASLLGGRVLPAIADLDPATIGDFGPHGVLLDFSRDRRDPAIPWLGRALADEGAHPDTVATLADVPAGSLLSRLSDHYTDVVANRAPIGFEAEFQNVRGNHALYRGILMPFSSDGSTIDFIYGVINWKEIADAALVAGIAAEVDRAPPPAPRATAAAAWADGPSRPAPRDAGTASEGSELRAAAVAGAQLARSTEQRARAVLFRALGLAYDAVLADAESGRDAHADSPGGQAERIADVVRQVFGAESRRQRADYAAVLAFGLRTGVGPGALRMLLEQRGGGGVRAVAADERRARRGVMAAY